MNNKKFLAILLIAFLVGVVAVAAYTAWHGSITWQIIEKKFSVYEVSDGGVELPTDSQFDIGVITQLELPYTYTQTFYLQNDGTVDFTVTATGTTTGDCLDSWSDEGSYNLVVGDTRVLATLTLTITGAGSYEFDFTIA